MLLKDYYAYTKICSILFYKLHWQISITPQNIYFFKKNQNSLRHKKGTFPCIKDPSDQIIFSAKCLYLFSPNPTLLPNYGLFGKDGWRMPGVYCIYSQYLRQYRHPVAQLQQDMYIGQQRHRKMLEDHFIDNSKSIISNCVGEDNAKSLKYF